MSGSTEDEWQGLRITGNRRGERRITAKEKPPGEQEQGECGGRRAEEWLRKSVRESEGQGQHKEKSSLPQQRQVGGAGLGCGGCWLLLGQVGQLTPTHT